MKRWRFSSAVICLALPRVPVQLFAKDLSVLDKGRNVRVAMIGQGPLCEGKFVRSSPAVVTVKLSKATPDCGRKDDLIYVSGANVVDLLPILANVVVPAMVFYAGWRAVPKRVNYVLIMTCPDRRHCVSTSAPSTEPAP